jgi:DNA helicase-2/ATP-dependent DNA helicase PcrA
VISSDYHLSAEQDAAVRSSDPAIVVVASAGSGKTEVAARRVERLLGESPGGSFRILALSYTLKAAEELGQRFRERLGDLRRRVDTSTVHGFAHSLLRQHGTRIGLPVEPEVLVRDEDRAEVLARWLEAEGRPIPDDFVTIFQRLDLARARQQPAPLLEEWEAALESAGALDYGSMLVRAADLLELKSAHRQLARLYAHVIVDEAQNLTAAQYTLLTSLIGAPSADSQHLPTMVVGDDKQSIVGFAGADPQLISRFAAEYGATRFELRTNFRSATAIALLGESVADQLGDRRAGSTDAVEYAAPGVVELHEAADEEAEAHVVSDWVAGLLDHGLPERAIAAGESVQVRPDDIAVLSRAAAGLRATQVALESAGQTVATSSSADDWLATLAGKVAFEMVALRSAGGHKSTHWQLARLLDTDDALVSSPDGVAQVLESELDAGLRILAPICAIDMPGPFISALTQLEMPSEIGNQRLADWDADCRQLTDAWLSFVQQTDVVEQTWGNFRLHVSRQQRGDDLAPGVRLLTIHKAQGREYRAVALVGLNEGQLPDFRATTSEEQLSELRTFYVAVTRPSRLLLVTRARSRVTRYGPRATDPSPFLRFLRRDG